MRDSPKLSRRARAPFRNLAQAILAAQIDKADAVRLLRRGPSLSPQRRWKQSIPRLPLDMRGDVSLRGSTKIRISQ